MFWYKISTQKESDNDFERTKDPKDYISYTFINGKQTKKKEKTLLQKTSDI